MTRSLVVSVLSISVAGGIVLGMAARLAMRWVALESGLAPGGSLGGTLEVIAFSVLVGTPIASVFLLLRPRIRVPKPGLTAAAFAVVLVGWMIALEYAERMVRRG